MGIAGLEIGKQRCDEPLMARADRMARADSSAELTAAFSSSVDSRRQQCRQQRLTAVQTAV